MNQAQQFDPAKHLREGDGSGRFATMPVAPVTVATRRALATQAGALGASEAEGSPASYDDRARPLAQAEADRVQGTIDGGYGYYVDEYDRGRLLAAEEYLAGKGDPARFVDTHGRTLSSSMASFGGNTSSGYYQFMGRLHRQGCGYRDRAKEVASEIEQALSSQAQLSQYDQGRCKAADKVLKDQGDPVDWTGDDGKIITPINDDDENHGFFDALAEMHEAARPLLAR
jgi:hypothetical protein